MRQLTEQEAENFLEKEGFEIVARACARSKKGLKKIQKKIRFPWAMKVSSTNIVHKAKVGGVRLNISTLKEAEEKFDELCKIQGSSNVMIQRMLSGNEIILGIKKTPEFSHVIMFGLGGSKVETEKDVSFRVLPASKEDIQEMMKETRVYSELVQNKVNMKKILAVITKIVKLVSKYPKLSELDINPLIVNDKKAVVVDARMSFDK
jgi:succinyl-CoA synthetase beta subunit